MSNLRRTLCLAVILIFSLQGALIVTAEAGGQSPQNKDDLMKRVLILYEDRTFFGDQRDSVTVIRDLLGHFHTQTEELELSKWDGRLLTYYDVVFVIALDKQFNKPNLIDALTTYKGQIIWLGASVEPLLKAGYYPLTYLGSEINFQSVSYAPEKNMTPVYYPVGSKREFFIVQPQDDTTEVLSSFTDGYNEYPFMLSSRNLLYVSRVDMNEPLFYIFADVLSRVFYKAFYHENQFFIAIEDVHVFSDTNKLRTMADELSRRHMPFVIGLIPFIQQAGANYTTSFTEVTEVVKTLQYMQSKGGLVVLHLYSHKMTSKDLVASPELDDPKTPMDTYLRKALMACIDNEIFPVGVEEPHKTLTPIEYEMLKNRMSTFWGQLYVSDNSYVIYPFDLFNTKNFNQFIPLNLGYIDNTNEDPYSLIKSRLDKLTIVRGFLGGLYFHSSQDPKELTKVLDYLEQKHIATFHPLSRSYWTRVGDIHYTIENGQVIVEQLPQKAPPSLLQMIFSQISNIMILVLIIAFAGFSRAIYKLRQTRKRAISKE